MHSLLDFNIYLFHLQLSSLSLSDASTNFGKMQKFNIIYWGKHISFNDQISKMKNSKDWLETAIVNQNLQGAECNKCWKW